MHAMQTAMARLNPSSPPPSRLPPPPPPRPRQLPLCPSRHHHAPPAPASSRSRRRHNTTTSTLLHHHAPPAPTSSVPESRTAHATTTPHQRPLSLPPPRAATANARSHHHHASARSRHDHAPPPPPPPPERIPKMHSFLYRENALVTFAVTILAVICCIASVTDTFNVPTPSADIQVLNINWFQKHQTGDDEVRLTLNITEDLQSLFTWNTKQVFFFLAAEYETADNALNQGNNLRGKEFNLTLQWHVMPKTGKMLARKIVKTSVRPLQEAKSK